jgi:hypothetical protein
MTSRILRSILWVGLSAPLLWAGDLSKYRNFQIGTHLDVIVKQVQAAPSEVKVIHQQPAMVQEL